MVNLSSAEKLWLKKLQDLLDKCPTERFGSYTTGDDDITIFDKVKFDEWSKTRLDLHESTGELCYKIQKAGAFIQTIDFPFSVESTSG